MWSVDFSARTRHTDTTGGVVREYSEFAKEKKHRRVGAKKLKSAESTKRNSAIAQ